VKRGYNDFGNPNPDSVGRRNDRKEDMEQGGLGDVLRIESGLFFSSRGHLEEC
jgi:hypothetical protein